MSTSFHSRALPLSLALAFSLLSFGAHAQDKTPQQPGVVQKTENAVGNAAETVKEDSVKAYDATKQGAKKAYKATKRTTKKAYKATKHGVEKGVDATENAAHKAAGATRATGEKIGEKIPGTAEHDAATKKP